MSSALKILGGLLIVVISFVATLQIMDYSDANKPPPSPPPPRCAAGTLTPLARPFTKFGNTGFAYLAAAPALAQFADAAEGNHSKLLLCENDKLIGPAHSLHADIMKLGQGRFSHWASGVIFAPSDNSDPNTNGRRYSLITPP